MRAQQVFRLSIAVAAILIAGSLQAQVLNNEVEFSGVISDVVANGDGGGTLFVEIDGFDLRVIVNAKTVLLDADDEPTEFAKIVKGASVLISGKFSSSGVLATKVQLSDLQVPNTFEVSGHITGIESSVVSLLGLSIDTTGITGLPALNVGTWIHVEGTIDAGKWIAETIKVVDPGKRKGRVTFEGIVESYEDPVLEVLVTGTTDNVTKVLITSGTRVTGELVKGAHVSVIGKFKNFDIEAKEVEVLGPFEVKPDERKLKIGEIAKFTIKLREPAPTGGVTFGISVDVVDRIALSASSATISGGGDSTDFSVEAKQAGQATITITAKELNNASVTVLVKVGAVSESENERPAGEARVAFAPDHIKMGLEDTREVVLLVQPPQSGVALKVTDKDGQVVQSALTAVEGRELGNGVAQQKVTVTSTSATGSYTVTATLGLAVAELLVEVEDKTHGKKN